MAFMNWEKPGMGPAETWALITQVAEALGQARVSVQGIHDGVGGNLPYAYGCKQPVIRFSVTKSPQRMAGEITRRLLPTVRDDAAILATERAERDARLAGRLTTLKRARNLMNGDLTWNEQNITGQPAEYDNASNRNYRYGETPHVVIKLKDYRGSDHMDEICVHHLDHEQVLVIVEAAARIITARPL